MYPQRVRADEQYIDHPIPAIAKVDRHHNHNLLQGLEVNVMEAVGGRVVTFQSHDRVRDETNYRSYILTHDDNFGKELAKLICLESLRVK